MVLGKDMPLPWWKKYTLTIEEASNYFWIGEKTLRRFINEHKDEDFIIYNGTKVLVKRKVFEKFIDENINTL
ncbi:excisionase [Clostridium chromiireducens]|uniref:Excisionase n=1 Tax=Clostridium chromiireducens TaxID=225345 RepID=A0A964RSL6_9CLOT|nr:excisionase [Clostridium chromiireducens]MVX67017.1 excisionase [Clostridium chromiireducens]